MALSTNDEIRFRILQMTSRTKLKRKEVDDVLGGDEMWKHADATAGPYNFNVCHESPSADIYTPASCDKCNHNLANFYQLQIRSADEPMTTCKSLCSLQDSIYSLISKSTGISAQLVR
jgi:DNA-directed RNA polymerase subunit M/transcription elongation factor TFIIS